MSSSILHALERLILPNACVSCGRPAERRTPDTLVCGVCRSRLRPIPSGCPRCRQPTPPVGPCRFCADWPTALRWVQSAVWLGAEARALVHHLKYDGYPGLADLAADVISRAVARPRGTRWVLIPIPLTPRRLRLRGYNQAALIAHALARRWRLPCVEQLLSRNREAGSQTRLTPQERARNVAGVFHGMVPSRGVSRRVQRTTPRRGATPALPAVQPNPVADEATVILVDDVLTTGATMAAAAAALEEAGWARVAAISFARALPFELRALLG